MYHQTVAFIIDTVIPSIKHAVDSAAWKAFSPPWRYRNHKLTQLMMDSIGGNAKTLMFVNVSPALSNTEETVSALTYATRAKQVPRGSQDPGSHPSYSASQLTAHDVVAF